MGLEIIKLESVGCGFCTCCGTIYPLLKNGEYDYDNSTHISEAAFEWTDLLSKDDFYTIIKHYPDLNTYLL